MNTQAPKSETSSCDHRQDVARDNLLAITQLVHEWTCEESTSSAESNRRSGTDGIAEIPLPGRTAGYQYRRPDQAPWPPKGKVDAGWQMPKPLPKRPTGRFFVGGLLACFVGVTSWHVWTTFFSVVAYGVVEADTLKITPPWECNVARLHVHEGQSITKGQLLVSLECPRLRDQLQRLQEELQIESAKLEAEQARVLRESHFHTAQYFQMWATLQKSRQEWSLTQQDLEMAQAINDSGVMTRQAYNRVVASEAGQREFVEKLTLALDELRLRSERNRLDLDGTTHSLLKPIQARIHYLNNEISRTQAEIGRGEVHAPISGIVTRSRAVVGQTIPTSDSLLEIVADQSLKIELFVPQKAVANYQEGKEVKLSIYPHSEPIVCTVVGSRNRFEAAPDSIQQYYLKGETLMPIILAPQVDPTEHALYVGAVTKFTLLDSIRGN